MYHTEAGDFGRVAELGRKLTEIQLHAAWRADNTRGRLERRLV